MLIQFPSVNQANNFQTKLQHQGIFIRSCASFRTLDASFVRIALLTPTINEKIYTTFEQTRYD
jgi:histidinol-phosphate/aromatic aminotransferase/cobyric acid decarboxylase-like protein